MKRCPECRRDYYDETLLYCLDDGNALLDGPANRSEPPASAGGQFGDGSKTAILHSTDATGEAPTRAQINTDDQTAILRTGAEAEPQGGLDELSEKPSFSAHRATKPLIAAVVVVAVLVGGFFGYRYFMSGSSRQINSIAVMPFVNEGGNPDLEYLSDGMAETLRNSLSQIPDLNLKARSSVIRYKNKDADAKTIGRELGVQAILTGEVVQRGDALTLFLELVDVGTGDRIWGRQYDRKQSELLILQTEIARDVFENLKTRLTGSDVKLLAKKDTVNPEAYRLYLQGRFFWNKRRIGDMGKAISFFQQAIDLDPNYARAYAGFADAVAQPSDIVPHAERAAKSRAAALKSLELDDNLAEAHTALAHILLRYDLDFAGAERELKRAIELDPKWPDTYHRYGELYSALGSHDEALAKYRQGLKSEPFNLPLNTALGGAMIFARRYDEAITQLKIAVELDPNHRNAHVALYTVYGLKGLYPEAIEHRVTALKLANQDKWAESIREGFAREGWAGVVIAELQRFELVERTFDRLPYYNEAHLLASIGKKDKAFASLAKSVENREQPALVFLKVDPRFDPLRDDPRFTELLRKVGFPL